MSNFISRRHLLSSGLAAVGATVATAALAADKGTEKTKAKDAAGKAPVKASTVKASTAKASTPTEEEPTQLSVEGLGTMLEAMGLKPNRFESSFNFTFPFKAKVDGDKVDKDIEWNMTMAATMSTDEQGIWITAFLAELPQTAADVPRTALLRLLAQNDEMGEGIFFAYIPKVKKIVLECFIANEDISSALFKECLTELASRVAGTQQYWNVAEWKQGPAAPNGAGKDAAADEKKSAAGEKPAALTGAGKEAKPIRTTAKDADAGAATKKK
ncbi:MAG TPA: hypothetical protein VGH74_03105 [Planctomycetaceae bacterium]|jgi:hypothetical protein